MAESFFKSVPKILGIVNSGYSPPTKRTLSQPVPAVMLRVMICPFLRVMVMVSLACAVVTARAMMVVSKTMMIEFVFFIVSLPPFIF